MNVAVDVLGSVEEPFLHVRQEHVLEMSLRPGWMKVGPRLGVLNSVSSERAKSDCSLVTSNDWWDPPTTCV